MNENHSSTLHFHSSGLQKAVEKAKATVEGYLSSLDQISEDIKNLEKWFAASGLRTKVTSFLYNDQRGYFDSITKPNVEICLDQSGLPSGVVRCYHDVEMISWEPQKGTDRWRLMYSKVRRFDILPVGSEETVLELSASKGSDRDDEVLVKKPLIEISSETRRLAYKSLPGLVDAVARSAEVKEWPIPVTNA